MHFLNKKKLAIRDPFYKHRTAKYMSIPAMPFPALPIRENVFRVRKMVFHHCARAGPGPPEKIGRVKEKWYTYLLLAVFLWVGEIAKLGKIGSSENLLRREVIYVSNYQGRLVFKRLVTRLSS